MVEIGNEVSYHKSLGEIESDAFSFAYSMGSPFCNSIHLLLSVSTDPSVSLYLSQEGVNTASLEKSSQVYFGKKSPDNLEPSLIELDTNAEKLLNKYERTSIKEEENMAMDMVLDLVGADKNFASRVVYVGAINFARMNEEPKLSKFSQILKKTNTHYILMI